MQATHTQTRRQTAPSQSRAVLRIEGMFRSGQQSLQDRNRRVQMLRDAIRHHAHHVARHMSHHTAEAARATLNGDGEAVSHLIINSFLKALTEGAVFGMSEAMHRSLRQKVTALDKTVKMNSDLSPEARERIMRAFGEHPEQQQVRQTTAPTRTADRKAGPGSFSGSSVKDSTKPRKTPQHVLTPTRTPAPPMPHI